MNSLDYVTYICTCHTDKSFAGELMLCIKDFWFISHYFFLPRLVAMLKSESICNVGKVF